MAWDENLFRQTLARKYEILGKNADTTAQDVAQKPVLQAQADAAALARAQLGADTQTNIATMENQTTQDRLAQQNTQFGASHALDVAKAADANTNARLSLTRPTTTYDETGMKHSTPGVDFTNPPNIGKSAVTPLIGTTPTSSGLAGLSDQEIKDRAALEARKKVGYSTF